MRSTTCGPRPSATSSAKPASSSKSAWPWMPPLPTTGSSIPPSSLARLGVGKSALAGVIAQEMATGFLEVLGQSIKTPADLNALLLAAKAKDVLHIDECHEMKKEFQTALYLAMDQRKFVVQSGCGASPYAIPIEDFTLLLSTTDEYCLLQPLRDRMKLTLRFEFYSAEELTKVAFQRAKGLGWDVEELVFPQIAQRARGTPAPCPSSASSSPSLCQGQWRINGYARSFNGGV